MQPLSRRLANFIGFVICAAMLAYALYAQYVELLDPCPLCLFQRFAVIGMGVVFLLAALHNPRDKGARAYGFLVVFIALLGVGTAARHIWIQAQPPGSIAACGASLSYLFDIMSVFDVVKKVFSGSGECAKVDALLGISWPWWVAMALTALGAWGLVVNWKGKRGT